MARGSIPGGGKTIRTRSDRTWGPLSLLYNGYRVFPGGKAAGAWRWPPTPSSTEVKERAELYLYSTSGPSWPVTGCTSPFTFTLVTRYLKSILQASCYFLPTKCTYPSQHPLPKQTQSLFFHYCDRPIFTSIQYSR